MASLYRVVFLGSEGTGINRIFSRYFYGSYVEQASHYDTRAIPREQTKTLRRSCLSSDSLWANRKYKTQIISFKGGTLEMEEQLQLTGAAIAVLCVSLSKPQEEINHEIDQAKELLAAYDVPMVLVGTKIDLLDLASMQEQLDELNEQAKQQGFEHFYPVSAKENYNVEYLFSQLLYTHLSLHTQFGPDQAFLSYQRIWESCDLNLANKAMQLLNDYIGEIDLGESASKTFTEVIGYVNRMASGHFARSHVDAVSDLIEKIKSGSLSSLLDVVLTLKELRPDPGGSLASRVEFLSTKMETEPAVEYFQSKSATDRLLNDESLMKERQEIYP